MRLKDVHFSFPEHILDLAERLPLNFIHNKRGLFVPFGVTELGLLLVQYYDRPIDVLTYTSFPEQISKTTGWITAISHIHDLKGP